MKTVLKNTKRFAAVFLALAMVVLSLPSSALKVYAAAAEGTVKIAIGTESGATIDSSVVTDAYTGDLENPVSVTVTPDPNYYIPDTEAVTVTGGASITKASDGANGAKVFNLTGMTDPGNGSEVTYTLSAAATASGATTIATAGTHDGVTVNYTGVEGTTWTPGQPLVISLAPEDNSKVLKNVSVSSSVGTAAATGNANEWQVTAADLNYHSGNARTVTITVDATAAVEPGAQKIAAELAENASGNLDKIKVEVAPATATTQWTSGDVTIKVSTTDSDYKLTGAPTMTVTQKIGEAEATDYSTTFDVATINDATATLGADSNGAYTITIPAAKFTSYDQAGARLLTFTINAAAQLKPVGVTVTGQNDSKIIAAYWDGETDAEFTYAAANGSIGMTKLADGATQTVAKGYTKGELILVDSTSQNKDRHYEGTIKIGDAAAKNLNTLNWKQTLESDSVNSRYWYARVPLGTISGNVSIVIEQTPVDQAVTVVNVDATNYAAVTVPSGDLIVTSNVSDGQGGYEATKTSVKYDATYAIRAALAKTTTFAELDIDAYKTSDYTAYTDAVAAQKADPNNQAKADAVDDAKAKLAATGVSGTAALTKTGTGPDYSWANVTEPITVLVKLAPQQGISFAAKDDSRLESGGVNEIKAVTTAVSNGKTTYTKTGSDIQGGTSISDASKDFYFYIQTAKDAYETPTVTYTVAGSAAKTATFVTLASDTATDTEDTTDLHSGSYDTCVYVIPKADLGKGAIAVTYTAKGKLSVKVISVPDFDSIDKTKLSVTHGGEEIYDVDNQTAAGIISDYVVEGNAYNFTVTPASNYSITSVTASVNGAEAKEFKASGVDGYVEGYTKTGEGTYSLSSALVTAASTKAIVITVNLAQSATVKNVYYTTTAGITWRADDVEKDTFTFTEGTNTFTLHVKADTDYYTFDAAEGIKVSVGGNDAQSATKGEAGSDGYTTYTYNVGNTPGDIVVTAETAPKSTIWNTVNIANGTGSYLDVHATDAYFTIDQAHSHGVTTGSDKTLATNIDGEASTGFTSVGDTLALIFNTNEDDDNKGKVKVKSATLTYGSPAVSLPVDIETITEGADKGKQLLTLSLKNGATRLTNTTVTLTLTTEPLGSDKDIKVTMKQDKENNGAAFTLDPSAGTKTVEAGTGIFTFKVSVPNKDEAAKYGNLTNVVKVGDDEIEVTLSGKEVTGAKLGGNAMLITPEKITDTTSDKNIIGYTFSLVVGKELTADTTITVGAQPEKRVVTVNGFDPEKVDLAVKVGNAKVTLDTTPITGNLTSGAGTAKTTADDTIMAGGGFALNTSTDALTFVVEAGSDVALIVKPNVYAMNVAISTLTVGSPAKDLLGGKTFVTSTYTTEATTIAADTSFTIATVDYLSMIGIEKWDAKSKSYVWIDSVETEESSLFISGAYGNQPVTTTQINTTASKITIGETETVASSTLENVSGHVGININAADRGKTLTVKLYAANGVRVLSGTLNGEAVAPGTASTTDKPILVGTYTIKVAADASNITVSTKKATVEVEGTTLVKASSKTGSLLNTQTLVKQGGKKVDTPTNYFTITNTSEGYQIVGVATKGTTAADNTYDVEIRANGAAESAEPIGTFQVIVTASTLKDASVTITLTGNGTDSVNNGKVVQNVSFKADKKAAVIGAGYTAYYAYTTDNWTNTAYAPVSDKGTTSVMIDDLTASTKYTLKAKLVRATAISYLGVPTAFTNGVGAIEASETFTAKAGPTPSAMTLKAVNTQVYDNTDNPVAVATLTYDKGAIVANTSNTNTSVTLNGAATTDLTITVANNSIYAAWNGDAAGIDKKSASYVVTVDPKGSLLPKTFKVTVAHGIFDVAVSESVTLFQNQKKAINYQINATVNKNNGVDPYKKTLTYTLSGVSSALSSYVSVSKAGKVTVKKDAPVADESFDVIVRAADQIAFPVVAKTVTFDFKTEVEKEIDAVVIAVPNESGTYTINPKSVTMAQLMSSSTEIRVIDLPTGTKLTSGMTMTLDALNEATVYETGFALSYSKGVTGAYEAYDGDLAVGNIGLEIPVSTFKIGSTIKITAKALDRGTSKALSIKTAEADLPATAKVADIQTAENDITGAKPISENGTLSFYNPTMPTKIAVRFEDSDGALDVFDPDADTAGGCYNVDMGEIYKFTVTSKSAKVVTVVDAHQVGQFGANMIGKTGEAGNIEISYTKTGVKGKQVDKFVLVKSNGGASAPVVTGSALAIKTTGQSFIITADLSSYTGTTLTNIDSMRADLPASYYDKNGVIKKQYAEAAALVSAINEASYNPATNYVKDDGAKTLALTVPAATLTKYITQFTKTTKYEILISLGDSASTTAAITGNEILTEQGTLKLQPQSLKKYKAGTQINLYAASEFTQDMTKWGTNYAENPIIGLEVYGMNVKNSQTKVTEMNHFAEMFKAEEVAGVNYFKLKDTAPVSEYLTLLGTNAKEATQQYLTGYVKIKTTTFNPSNEYLAKVTVTLNGNLITWASTAQTTAGNAEADKITAANLDPYAVKWTTNAYIPANTAAPTQAVMDEVSDLINADLVTNGILSSTAYTVKVTDIEDASANDTTHSKKATTAANGSLYITYDLLLNGSDIGANDNTVTLTISTRTAATGVETAMKDATTGKTSVSSSIKSQMTSDAAAAKAAAQTEIQTWLDENDYFYATITVLSVTGGGEDSKGEFCRVKYNLTTDADGDTGVTDQSMKCYFK